MPFCPSCRKYIDDSTEAYCPDCGTRLVQQPIPTAYPTIPSTGKASGSLWSQLSKLSPKTKLILGIVIVAIIVVAAAASAYHPGGPSGTTNPTGVANLPTKFTHWIDPQEGSFSVLLPQGWTAKGGVWRPDSIDWGFWLNATDGTGSMRVFFVLPGFPKFIDPQQAASIFCPTAEGSVCNLNQLEGISGSALPTYSVYSYMTAQDFVDRLLWTSLKNLEFIRPDSSNPQITASSDAAQRFAFYIGTSNYRGGGASIAYSSSGTSYTVKADVGLNNFCYLSVCSWSAALSGASAPQQNFNTVTDIYQLMIMPTFRISPQWLLSQIQNGGAQSSIISQFSTQMRQLSYDAFETQQSATIKAGEGWINALGGVMNMQDSSGNEYTVPSTIPDANYWWVSGSNVAWTKDSNGPSGYEKLTPAPNTG